MAAGFTPNTTCDVYRDGSTPPADPDVPGVPCWLRPAFPEGNEGDADASLMYSHIMDVALEVDVRDSTAGVGGTGTDYVYVPDQDGTQFRVVLVVRTGYGTGIDRRRVFLKRLGTPFPTTYL